MLKEKFIEEFLEQGAIISTPQNKVLLGWGPVIQDKSPSPVTQLSFYFPDFFLNNPKPWFVFESYLELSIHKLVELLSPYSQPKFSRVWHNPYKNFFRETLEDIRKKILYQQLQKAVPFIYEMSPTTMTPHQLALSLAQACRLADKYPLKLYGHWQKNEGILGLTPEILCSIYKDNNKWKINSFALAGTRDKSSRGYPMKADLKIWNEHNIVCEGIIASLKDFGKITISEMEELVLPYLNHLKTIISLETVNAPHLPSIISHLHPTPALGAFPRVPGIQWLKNYQTLIDRKYFGAPVGYKFNQINETHLYVAIRNVQWTPKQMLIGAGCGIVDGSQFEDEWYEINLKIKSIKEALAL